MAGIVISLTDQDMADLAAYYSSQTTSAGLTDEALRASGEQLYRAAMLKPTYPPACPATVLPGKATRLPATRLSQANIPSIQRKC